MKSTVALILTIFITYSGQCQEVARKNLVTLSLGPKIQTSKNFIVGFHSRVDYQLGSNSFIGLGYQYYNNQAIRSDTYPVIGLSLSKRTEVSDEISNRIFAYYKFYYVPTKGIDSKFQLFSYVGLSASSKSYTVLNETLVPTSSPDYSKTISQYKENGVGGLFSFGVEYKLPKGRLFLETIIISESLQTNSDLTGLDTFFLLQPGYQISF